MISKLLMAHWSSKKRFWKNTGNSELKSLIKRCDLNNQSSIERYVIQDLMTSALFISMASGIQFDGHSVNFIYIIVYNL